MTMQILRTSFQENYADVNICIFMEARSEFQPAQIVFMLAFHACHARLEKAGGGPCFLDSEHQVK
jgi:hypothetical protein